MPRRKIEIIPNSYYHIFNKSLTENTIFIERKDYDRFYKSMLRFEEDYKKDGFQIKAFCIMPNHFHLLLYIGEDPGVLPQFMMKRQMSYAKYYNHK